MRQAPAGETLAGQRIAAQLARADGVGELWNDDRGVQSPAHLAIENWALSAANTISQAAIMPVPPQSSRMHQRNRRHGRHVQPLHGFGGRARDAQVSSAEDLRTALIISGRRRPGNACRCP